MKMIPDKPEMPRDNVTVTMRGWYSATENLQASKECAVPRCRRESTFHLCKTHALPGMLAETKGITFVISFWLVERACEKQLITLNDYALGHIFGGQQQFEQELSQQGYKVHKLISTVEELKGLRQYTMMPWMPDLGESQR